MGRLSQLEAESRALDAEIERLSSGNDDSSLLKDAGQNAAWLGRTVAKGAAGIADLPVAARNLMAKGYNAFAPEEYQVSMSEYPSEWIGEKIDTATGGLTKPKGWQETASPYIESVASLPGFGLAGKALTKGARALDAVGKAAKTSKGLSKAGSFLTEGTKLSGLNLQTARNAGAAAGSTFGARQAESIAPDSVIGSIAGPIAGAALGRGLPSAGKGIVSLVNPRDLKNAYTEASLRYPQIGGKFIEELPTHKGGPDILKQTHEGAGELAHKGATAYKERFSNIFNKQKNRINHMIEETGVHPDKIEVDASPAIKYVSDIYNSLESPGMKADLIRSPAGQQIAKILPKDVDLTDALADPSSVTATVKYKDLMRLRENIDDTVGNFGEIGTNAKGELKTLRGTISKQTEDAIKGVSPEAYKALKNFNRQYSTYADRYIDSLNKITKHRTKPEYAYHAANEDLGKGGYDIHVALRGLKGAEKESLAKSLIRDLGKVGDNFDLETFSTNFHNLEPKIRHKILTSLGDKARNDVNSQLDIFKGYKALSKESNLADLLFRRPSLSLSKAIKKTLGRSISNEAWKTPEGRQKMIDAAMNAIKKGEGFGDITADLTKGSRTRNVLASQSKSMATSKLDSLIKEAQELGIDVSDILG